MSSTKYELYIRTPLDPQQIIQDIREYPGLSAPITTFLWKTVSEVTMYQCDFPLKRPDQTQEEQIHVSAYHPPAFWHKRVSEWFDALGMKEQPRTYIEVDFHLSTDMFFEDERLEILKLISLVLGLIDGDCILREEPENIRYCELIRKNGEVMIDPSYMSWSEEQKQALEVPLTITKIPVLPF